VHAGISVKSPNLVSIRCDEHDVVLAFSGNIDVLHIQRLCAYWSVNGMFTDLPEAPPYLSYGQRGFVRIPAAAFAIIAIGHIVVLHNHGIAKLAS
jgi:hypothetical protein